MVVGAAAIVAALAVANPHLSKPVRESYARTILVESKREAVDPLMMVAIFWHESGVRAGAVSRDGEDYGLGQIRARFYGACRQDADPVGAPSDECRAVKARLLEPAYNIRMTAQAVSKWRTTCREVTGTKATSPRWLAGYAGESRPGQGIWCGQRKVRGRWADLPSGPGVADILRKHRRLQRQPSARSGSASR